MSNNQPLLCFIDNLTLVSWLFYVLPFLVRARLTDNLRRKKIYYIDGSRPAVFLARLTLWLIGAELELLTFRLIDIRDEVGNLLRLRIACQDITDVQKDIMSNPVYKKIKNNYVVNDKMDTFMAKEVATISREENSMFRVLFLVQVAAWKVKKEENRNQDNVLFVHRRLWIEEIGRYGLRFGIKVISVRGIKISLKMLLQSVPGAKALVKRLYLRVLDLLRRPTTTGKRSVTQPCLAVDYYGHLNLNRPELHSDLFFWQQSELSGKDVLITFTIASDPLDQAKLKEIAQHGMATEVLHPKATTLAEVSVYCPPLRVRQIRKVKRIGNRLEEQWLMSRITEYQCLFDY